MTTMDWSSQGGSGPEVYESFLVPAMFAPFAERLVEQAGIEPGMRVLDVACGTGAASRAAAWRIGQDGSVTGVDLGEPTLAIARAQPVDEQAAPIEYLQSDAATLPVEDGSFDVALCQQGLQFFPDRPTALAAMRSALKPGGRLAVATWTSAETNPFGAIADALADHLGPEASQMMHSPFHLTREELAEAVEGAGFADVEVLEDSRTCTWAAAPAEFARRAIAAGPIQPLFSAAPEEAQDAVAAQVAERLTPNATPDGGGVRMPMTTYVALARA